MKSWKKQLKEEFDRAAPALSDEVKNAPIPITYTTHARDESSLDGNALVKRIGIFGGSVLAVFLALSFLLAAIVNAFPSSPDSFVFTFEINPAVAFVTDKDGVVTSVGALNEDADVLLAEDERVEELKNIPLSQALVRYTDAAAQLGYLDLSSTGDAVRLGYEKHTPKDLVDDARNGLQTYFRKNGIWAVVVENALSAKELCARAGFDGIGSLNALSNSLQKLSVRFDERIASDADEQTIKSRYESGVLGSQVLELVREELLDHVASIQTSTDMLRDILRLNSQITLHPDNPALLFKDYWSVKRFYAAQSGEFASLMDEMTERLADYEKTFGKEISGESDLLLQTSLSVLFAKDDPKTAILELTADSFLEAASSLIGTLQTVGCDVTELKQFFVIPQNVTEYVQAARQTNDMLYRSRLTRFLPLYEQERAEISEEEYYSFIESIEREFGSTDNYWNVQKK